MSARRFLERARTPAEIAVASPLALAAVVLAAIVVRAIVAAKIDAPQVPCDEFIYAEVARNLGEHGSYAFRGTHTLVSLVYPALIAPAWFLHSMQATYDVAKGINVVVMCLTAVPVYLWTRRLAAPGWALAAAAVTLLMPDFHFTALLMTEAAFLPAFVLAAFLIAVAVERPALRNQIFAVLAILLAIGVRLEAVSLLPVLPLATVIVAGLDALAEPQGERRATLRARLLPFWPTLAMLAALGIAYLIAFAVTGSRAPGFGFYEANTTKHYVLSAALRAARSQFEGVTLLAGIVPVSALIVLLGMIRRSPRPVRIFTTVTVLSSFWLLLEVGALKGDYVYERYSFYVIPLFLIALFAWIGLGMPRPLVWTTVAMLLPVFLVFRVSERLFSIPSVPNYFGFFVFYRLGLTQIAGYSGNALAVHWWIVAAAVFGAVFFGFVVRPVAAVVIPAAVAVFLFLSSFPPFGLLRDQGYGSRYAPSVGRDAQWVDNKLGTGAKVSFLYDAGPFPFETSLTMLETQFWNSSVRSIANVGSHEVCAIPEQGHTLQPDGTIVDEKTKKPYAPEYVVTNPVLRLDGDVLGRRESLTLYRLHSPARMLSRLDDVFRDGWTGPWATYTRYPGPGAKPRTLDLVLSRMGLTFPDVASSVLVQLWKGTTAGPAKPLLSRTGTIHMRGRLSFRLPTPPPPFHVEVHFAVPFSPSQFGDPDRRQLGAQLRLRLLPRSVRASAPAPPGTP